MYLSHILLCLTLYTTAVGAVCSLGCYNNTCNHSDVCQYGCTAGYRNRYCTACKSGYYKNSGACCPDNCKSCVSDTKCSECNDGFYGTICRSYCSSGCLNTRCNSLDGHCTCTEGYTGEKCTQCSDGWFKHNGYCYRCPNHCSDCTSSSYCTSCNEGYSGATCTWCLYGWYSYIENCYKCPRHCSSCTSSNSCTSCNEGYSGVTCTRCLNGWYKYNGNCYKCPDNCSGCTSSTCTSCNEGYTGVTCAHCLNGWFNYYGVCYKCPQHCSSCTSSTLCSSCTAGYYGLKCGTLCSYGCKGVDKECEQVSGKCMYDCRAGFQGDQCNECVAGNWGGYCDNECSPGCSGPCDKQTGYCSACKIGYSGNMCCVHNMNCDMCASNSECSMCVIGFYGLECGNVCPENCKGSCGKATGDCNACKNGFFGPKCNQSCFEDCAECNINGNCIKCALGLFGSFCNQSCPVNCKICTGMTSCGECQDGYFGTVCSEACPENCLSCISNTQCSICKQGFTGYKCHYKCSDDCLSCLPTNRYDCTKCSRGRYGNHWNNNISNCFHECSKNCLRDFCDERTGKCTEGCIGGYAGDKCECSENCQNGCYIGTGNCNGCKDGYSGDKCFCITDSEECNALVCESCSNNTWFRNTNGCCRCSGKCRNNQCEDSSTCSGGCIDGYYGLGCQERCSHTDILCLSCTNETCLQCIIGFYSSKLSKTCIPCPQYCLNGNCSAFNGTCLEGCKKGYWGEHCDLQCGSHCEDCDRYTGVCNICENGRFTRNCTKNCSSNCLSNEDEMVCIIDNGQCELGCSRATVHGVYCDMPCNNTCMEQTCNWTDGRCVHGCIHGYFGEWCDHICSGTCNEQSGDSKCSDVDGFCTFGCRVGYFGVTCESECGRNCVNKTCERLNGTCTYGCISGYEGNSCAKALGQEQSKKMGMIAGAAAGSVTFLLIALAILFICIVMRRRQRKKADNMDCSSEYHGHSNVAFDKVEPVYNNAPVSATVEPATFKHRKSETTIADNPAYENHIPHMRFTKSQITENGHEEFVSNTENKQYDNIALNINDSGRNNMAVELEESGETVLDDEGQPVGDTYYNAEAIVRKGVTVDKLAEYVAGKSKEDLIKEFQSIPSGLTKPYADSQLRENMKRNRYKGLYPYDENRVRLLCGNSDYINASYIDGFNNDRTYIAALGPTDTTTNIFFSFWTMVWQENVEKIVMLTNLVENAKMKCEQYWPNLGTDLDYGDFKVISMVEEQYSEFIVRTFSVTKDSEKRMLYHFHYTAWPDKGVPNDVTGLLEFRNKVAATKSSHEGPVIVHCSAGVGRTGTYIALDYLTKEGEETGSVDIFACFANLRAQRVFMIQAEEQYIYLHDAIVHSLTFDSKPIQGEKFHDYLDTLDTDTLKTKFAKLDFGSVKDEAEIKAVKRNSTHISKNHPQADIPGDRYRPKLYMSRAFDESDYINAVYLDSFRVKNHYVVTQTPLKETMEDFLTLLCQENFTCVVDMQPKPNKKGVTEYVPTDDGKSTHGFFEVETKKLKSNEEYVLRRLVVTNNSKSDPEERIFHHFKYTGWNHLLAVPPNPANFINFVSEVESKAKEDFDDGKILLHCISGAERSCLFCAVSVMLQKMESEQEVSVVNVLRHLRSRRPKAIPTKEQYLFCHQCVGAFLDTFDTYSNFAIRQ